MHFAPVKILAPLILAGLLASGSLQAQGPVAAPSGVEPGLEKAVKWKWRIAPSDPQAWGLELPEPPPPPTAPGAMTPVLPSSPQNEYTVQRGDALAKIARKFNITVQQLKIANNLQTDLIRVGDVLKIPTPEEIAAMNLPVEPVAAAPKKTASDPSQPPTAIYDPEVLMFQIFLDRQGFSPGPIDGKSGLGFQKLMYLYQTAGPGGMDIEVLRARAKEAVGPMFTRYTLKPEDFRFIAPPKAEKALPGKPEDKPKPGSKPKAKASPTPVPPPPPPTYDDLTTAPMLAYRSPWEFVAERYHCNEAFLRELNPSIKTLPAAGVEFLVPNVEPFEIEKAFDSPLQPKPDPQHVITAMAVDLNRLEIYSNDQLIAIFPMSPARPGLRGRGSWRILHAIPRPRLGTVQEPREKPRPVSNFFVGENPHPEPTPTLLASEQFLPAGPRNPVGIFWLELVKTDSPDPLPYGLHGTSIPDRMNVRESLGGFRLTNWDIARAVRLLPEGTPLVWRQTTAPTPAARPAL